jgi:ribosomal 50S subunit-recycling heat shock protein
MRLDVFLKMSRLMPRRSVAQQFCDAGMISINGSVAKSSKEVKVGDEVEIRRRDKHVRLVIRNIPATKQIAKSAASGLYELIEERPVEDRL